ncbi:MAG: HepT-like ribonuclease domain-containing protein [Desulfitobacteriaceae bacterium]
MVKFRNRIVQLYQEVGDAEIYRILQENLDDIKGFIQAVLSKYF